MSETVKEQKTNDKWKILKDLGKTLLVYFISYCISLLVLVGLFHTPLFSSINVLMYRGIIFIVMSGIVSAVFTYIIMRIKDNKSWLSAKDIFVVFCACCCINMAMFILIPVTVERSVSVFMLSYMDENDSVSYTEDDIKKIFVDKYVDEYGAFEKRFEEQIVTGTIEETSDGKYKITDQGKSIVGMFRVVADLFQTDKRLVYPNEN